MTASCSVVRVRYAETDQMGFAWHGNFFAWFEVGRTDLLRQTGSTYRELEAEGVRLPVIDASAQYLRPARYDDELQVRTKLESMAGARVVFTYEVWRAGEGGPAELLATGSTTHATVDTSGRPRRVPEELRRRLS